MIPAVTAAGKPPKGAASTSNTVWLPPCAAVQMHRHEQRMAVASPNNAPTATPSLSLGQCVIREAMLDNGP